MKLRSGYTVALAHLLILLGMVAKYAYERETLPRVWARTISVDPDTPLRGRYIRMTIEVQASEARPRQYQDRFRLEIVQGALVARRHSKGHFSLFQPGRRFDREDDPNAPWALTEPVDFYLPEGVPDPTILKPNERLWVELTVPANGSLRPLRCEKRTTP
jgi:hypothetical protein